MNAPARKPAATAPEAQPADALPFRTAPHNIEAEQALLGAILVNNEAHDRVSGFLEPRAFLRSAAPADLRDRRPS